MYRVKINRSRARAAWMLEDQEPFEECTSLSSDGTMASGSSYGFHPLVSGASASRLFDRNSVAKFPSEFFEKGSESENFALEAWVLTLDERRRNLSSNPTPTVNSNGFAGANGSTLTRQTGSRIVGSNGIRVSCPSNGIADVGVNVSAGVNVEFGFYYTVSVFVRAVTAGTYSMSIQGTGGPQTDPRLSKTLAAGEVSRFTRTWSPKATGQVAAYILRTVGSATQDFDVDGVLIEKSAYPGSYFDGNEPGYEWVGSANASNSIRSEGVGAINLVKNPSFELDLSNWHINQNYTNTQAQLTRTSEESFGGGFSAKLVKGDGYAFAAASPAGLNIVPGETYTISAMVNPSTTSLSLILRETSLQGTSYSRQDKTGLVPNQWQRVTRTFKANDGTSVLQFDIGWENAIAPEGSLVYIDQVSLIAGGPENQYFDGDSQGASWSSSAHNSYSYLDSSHSYSQVLSNVSSKDGISVSSNRVRFGTRYENYGDSFCYHNLEIGMLTHIVGVHTSTSNELWVNGVMVASVDITEQQQSDEYLNTDGFLYLGGSAIDLKLAVNGLAIYKSMEQSVIESNYLAGIDSIGQYDIPRQFGGRSIAISSSQGTRFIDYTWSTPEDFLEGLLQDVQVSNTAVVPNQLSGLSEAGLWASGVPLDSLGLVSIYGVSMDWAGEGVLAEYSIDGVNWYEAANGQLLEEIPENFDPTDTDLHIRFSFEGGVENDTSYLDYVRVRGYSEPIIDTLEKRAVSYTHPAVLREDYSPNLYREDNGLSLNGGSLVIGPDTSDEPFNPVTLEFWVKPNSGVSLNTLGVNSSINGVPSAIIETGRWSLVHVIFASGITSDLIISGDAIIGQLAIYDRALNNDEISHIYKSYTGRPVWSVYDPSPISISEEAQPASLYSHVWSRVVAGA